MSPTQFSLFFAALMVGYVLIHLRLVKYEKYLQEIAGLRNSMARFDSLAESVGKLSLEQVEEHLEAVRGQLGQLGSDFRELIEVAERVEVGLEHEPPTAVAVPPEPEVEPDAVAQTRALIESRLLSLGYAKLRILTDLAGVAFGDEEIAVTVECEKERMGYKGRVTVQDGRICDVEMSSVVRSFP